MSQLIIQIITPWSDPGHHYHPAITCQVSGQWASDSDHVSDTRRPFMSISDASDNSNNWAKWTQESVTPSQKIENSSVRCKTIFPMALDIYEAGKGSIILNNLLTVLICLSAAYSVSSSSGQFV